MDIADDLTSKAELLKTAHPNTLAAALDIELTKLHKNCVQGVMPVSAKTRQPFGVLHGGASAALAETLASIGGWLNIDEEHFVVVGIEINANHLRPVSEGEVVGTATPIHLGQKTQVWDIQIRSKDEKLVCVSRCTLAVLSK